MKRFTEWNKEHTHGSGLAGTDCFTRLAEYEDLDESGRLVTLPCAPYSMIYRICPLSPHLELGDKFNGKIIRDNCERCPYEDCNCSSIGYQKGANNVIQEIQSGDEVWILCRRDYFGKHYFLTREEAEETLAELKASN